MNEKPLTEDPAAEVRIGREFADVDASGAAEDFIRFLDMSRRQGLLAEGKSWSFDQMRLAPGHEVLDVGCGTGDDVAAMAAMVAPGGRAVGIDRSETMIAEATHRHAAIAGVSFKTGDAQTLPFENATFDACRCERTLMHLAEPVAAVGEIARVLRPGGRVALIEPDWEGLLIEGADPELSARIWRSTFAGARQPRIGRRLRTLLLDAGFTDVTIEAAVGVVNELGVALQRFHFDQLAADAVSAGTVTAGEAETWLRRLREADERGRFLCIVLNLRAAATR